MNPTMLHLLLQTSTAPTDFNSTAANILPLVIAALLLDVAIVAIWYMLGVLIKNDAVKESAKGEYYQFLGTAFIAVLLVFGMVTFGSVAYSVLGSTKLMSSSAMTTMCNNIESNASLGILGNSQQGGSFLAGYTTTGGKSVSGICNMLGGSSLTDKINYPIIATTIVIANLTNQSVNNLNSAMIFSAYLGFLSKLEPKISLCFGECLFPSFSTVDYIRVTATYTPYAGYALIYSNLSALGSLLTLSTESYVAQLLVIWIIIFAWPYLLFGGLVLRSTFFTRKLGGLLIAIALGAIIVFPTIYAIEYLTLGNGIPTLAVPSSVTALPENTIYGFNSITSIPQVTTSGGTSTTGNYAVNFFVPPSLMQIAQSNQCWPSIRLPLSSGAILTSLLPSAALPVAEVADIEYLLTPGASIVSALTQVFTGSISSSGIFWMPAYCPTTGAISTFQEMNNAYGIIGVTSYFLPIVNLIITMTAIVGMSGLMGGDTKLEGLSKFV